MSTLTNEEHRVMRVVVVAGGIVGTSTDSVATWSSWLDAILEVGLDEHLEVEVSLLEHALAATAWDFDWKTSPPAMFDTMLDDGDMLLELLTRLRVGSRKVDAFGVALVQTDRQIGTGWAVRGALDTDLLALLGPDGRALSLALEKERLHEVVELRWRERYEVVVRSPRGYEVFAAFDDGARHVATRFDARSTERLMELLHAYEIPEAADVRLAQFQGALGAPHPNQVIVSDGDMTVSWDLEPVGGEP